MAMTKNDMVDAALMKWREINGKPGKWAAFEAVTFPHFTICHVKHGVIYDNGIKEIPIESILWTLYNDGRYDPEVRLMFS